MADTFSSGAQSAGLPWSRDAGETLRFGAIVAVMLALLLPPALLIPTLDLPDIERSEAEQIPPRLARLVERPKPVATPEPVKPEPVKPEPEPEPDVQKDKPEKPAPEPVKAEPKPEPRPEPIIAQPASPQQTAEQAREKASRSGLLAMKDRLASLREPEPAPTRQFVVNTDSDSVASDLAPGDSEKVLRGSGGVTDAVVPETLVDVAGHEVREVEAPVEDTRGVVAKPADPRPSLGERAMSNIRKVFDAQKTALYSLYRRELRQDPTLEGKVLLELVIEPDGSVSACEVVSSELGHPSLEQRIAMRVRLFNFGAGKVETRKVRFPIDFLPG
ncbi:AgmX/PglI C-terminal domain-containing protein [Marinobacter sp.]|uniref:AgmX/PglI C-terminal domain-containing protein n=1 Tax=Marinobacter sp. TaxID=50741 RepID=UPI003A90E950